MAEVKQPIVSDGTEKRTLATDGSDSENHEDGPVAEINEARLLRKLDIKLLPAVGILYLLSFLDRSNGM